MWSEPDIPPKDLWPWQNTGLRCQQSWPSITILSLKCLTILNSPDKLPSSSPQDRYRPFQGHLHNLWQASNRRTPTGRACPQHPYPAKEFESETKTVTRSTCFTVFTIWDSSSEFCCWPPPAPNRLLDSRDIFRSGGGILKTLKSGQLNSLTRGAQQVEMVAFITSSKRSWIQGARAGGKVVPQGPWGRS